MDNNPDQHTPAGISPEQSPAPGIVQPTVNPQHPVSTTRAPQYPVGVLTPAPSANPAKKLKKKRLVIIIAVLLILIGGGAFAAAQSSGFLSKDDKTGTIAGDNDISLKDLTFVRYIKDAAYNQTKDSLGNTVNTRKESFTIELERNGAKQNIALDKTVVEFGRTTDDKLYSLSCSVPALGQVGGNNPSFTAQFFDKTGKKAGTKTWHALDDDAPVSSSDYCGKNYFSVEDKVRFNFTPKNYGREAVDALNYKVVFVTKDGNKKSIDTEIASDIDIPLGATPDEKTFLYARVSSKRVDEGCGESTDLAYKVPDYYKGTINELHTVDIATGKDTLIGTEKSFAAEEHPINISAKGYFSSNSQRYYLREGMHGGCGGGGYFPIRIAYIDLATNSLKTITSPEGKDYDEYTFTSDGKYIIESGSVAYDTAKEQEGMEPLVPTIIDTNTGEPYVEYGLTNKFNVTQYGNSVPGTFMGLSTTKEKNKYSVMQDMYIEAVTFINPSKKSFDRFTLIPDVNVKDASFDNAGLTTNPLIGYLNRLPAYDSETKVSTPSPTTLFNDKAVAKEVPYAQIIL